MAIQLGQRVVKDTETYNDYAIGLSLPIQITNVAFNQNFQTIDQVKTNIINLLSTKQGERLMQPEFGSGLYALLFEQMSDDIEERIETVIEETVAKWLPYVNIEEIVIDVSNTNRDRNTIEISLTFSVGQNPQLNEVTFTIEG